MNKIAGLLLLCTILSNAAFGIPTGLVVIPTAETIGANNYNFNLLWFDNLPFGSGPLYDVAAEYGIGNRFEGGLDYFSGKHILGSPVLNAKYLVLEDPVPLAIGEYEIGPTTLPNPYVVGMKDFGRMRLHLGATQWLGCNSLIAGLDTGRKDKLTLMGDYTSGPVGMYSLGVNYQYNENIGILFGAIYPNGGGPTTLTLQITFGASSFTKPDH